MQQSRGDIIFAMHMQEVAEPVTQEKQPMHDSCQAETDLPFGGKD